MEETICLLALNRLLNYNIRAAKKLIELTGSACAVFSLKEKELTELLGRSYRFIRDIGNEVHLRWAEEELKWADSTGISILSPFRPDDQYPRNLLECEDHPIVLYRKGTALFNNRKTIAIVGTRRSTVYGEKTCRNIIAGLKETGLNPLIVSGLAFGIDICAHRTALEYGLQTIAVLADGLEKIYPSSHTNDSLKIAKEGALLTEYPRGSDSLKVNFLRRNRIIAGMSDAIIIVESAIKGGAIITATLAHSYSRDIFAVPGRVCDSVSSGCNHLIVKNMANIFFDIDDMLEKMNWTAEKPARPRTDKPHTDPILKFQNTEKEKILLALGRHSELHIDDISNISGMSVSAVSAFLSELELESIIARLPGNRYGLMAHEAWQN